MKLAVLPFMMSCVQWMVICVLPTRVIRLTQKATRARMNLADAATLAVAIPLIIVLPVWAFDLRPMRGDVWHSYRAGVRCGAVVVLAARWALRRTGR